MARSVFCDFDLIVRIRPDLYIETSDRIDWFDIHHDSIKNGTIFGDSGYFIDPGLGFAAGDRFAVGSAAAMDIYAQTWDTTLQSQSTPMYATPRKFAPHGSFAYATFLQGHRMVSLPSLRSLAMLSPTMLSVARLRDLIQTDAAGRMDAIDQELLASLDADNGRP